MVVAQGIHRWDMRFRIGLLQDTKEIEKQIAKDAADAQKPPTVKTEAETKKDEAHAKDPAREKPKVKRPKIKPLPEAKAIELGANFVSETFLLGVGIALVLFENARRGRQETRKEEDQSRDIQELREADRLKTQALLSLEKEILKLRPKETALGGSSHRILPRELRELDDDEDPDIESRKRGWLPWLAGLFRADNKKYIEPRRLATDNAPEAPANVKPADPVPDKPNSVLDKVLSRTHARDVKPQATEHSAESNPVGLAKTVEKSLDDGSIDATKKR